VESFSESSLPWMGVYGITSSAIIPLSFFGFTADDKIPSLEYTNILEAHRVDNLKIVSERKALVMPLGTKHCLLIPDFSSFPNAIEDELSRIGTLADSDLVSRVDTVPSYPFSRSSPHELLSHGVALNMKTISLFVLDFSETINFLRNICPLSIHDSFVYQLEQFAQSLIGATGICRSMSGGRILCAQYGRIPADPELVAVQISKTYNRALNLPKGLFKAQGPFTVVSIAETAVEKAEEAIRSFTDGLGKD